MPDINSNRYFFEHQFLPKLYYDPNILLPVEIKRNPELLNMNWKNILEKTNVPDAYPDGIWKVQGYEIDPHTAVMRVVCPEPEKEPQCYWIHLLFQYNLKKRFFFTVEKGGLFEEGPFLCGWDRNLKHLNFGVCENHIEKSLDQAIEIFRQMPDNYPEVQSK